MGYNPSEFAKEAMEISFHFPIKLIMDIMGYNPSEFARELLLKIRETSGSAD